jgi:hypothetical protein
MEPNIGPVKQPIIYDQSGNKAVGKLKLNRRSSITWQQNQA